VQYYYSFADMATHEENVRIPEKNHWMLQEKIDFQRGDVNLHLGELAEVFEKWDKVAPLLGLDDMEIEDIKDDFRKKEDQRYKSPH
jgi:hypothetical protein